MIHYGLPKMSNGIERSRMMQQYPIPLISQITTEIFEILKITTPQKPSELVATSVTVSTTPMKPKQIRETLQFPAVSIHEPNTSDTVVKQESVSDDTLISEKATADRIRNPHRYHDVPPDDRLDMHSHDEHSNLHEDSSVPETCSLCSHGNAAT